MVASGGRLAGRGWPVPPPLSRRSVVRPAAGQLPDPPPHRPCGVRALHVAGDSSWRVDAGCAIDGRAHVACGSAVHRCRVLVDGAAGLVGGSGSRPLVRLGDPGRCPPFSSRGNGESWPPPSPADRPHFSRSRSAGRSSFRWYCSSCSTPSSCRRHSTATARTRSSRRTAAGRPWPFFGADAGRSPPPRLTRCCLRTPMRGSSAVRRLGAAVRLPFLLYLRWWPSRGSAPARAWPTASSGPARLRLILRVLSSTR